MDQDTVDNQTVDYSLKQLPKKTFEIRAVVPWKIAEKAKKDALEQLAKKAEIKGFRKGKAPASIVEKSVSASVVFESTLEILLPGTYQQGLIKFNLKPVTDPKINVVSNEEGKAWEFTFTSCELPEVGLGDYKASLKGVAAGKEIWTPGQHPKGEENKTDPTEQRNKKVNAAIQWLIQNGKVEISDILVEGERARKLSRLLENLQKLGITLDQYLANTQKTSEQLIAEYNTEAENELKVEFILQKLADSEGITVDPSEIEKVISEAKTPEEKASLEKQKYVLSSLLRRQKTLDFLANL